MNLSPNQFTKDINVENLPSIPHTLIKLIDAFHDVDVDFKQISNLIQKDPALTAKMLTVANSAAYAQCTFKDFEQMLVVLGMDTVKTIATTAAVQQFFSQFNSDTKGYMSDFWLVSLNAAFFAKAIAKLIGYPNIDEAYLGGLIHQIGKLIFFTHYYQEYAQLIDESKTSIDLYNAEIKLFGLSSSELGSKLINSWQMQSLLDDAVLYQDTHADELFDTPLLIRIVNLAHKFSLLINVKNASAEQDKDQLLFIDHAYQLFGLTQGVIEDTFKSIQSDITNAAKSLGVELDTNKQRIDNSEEYSLFLAARVKNIALSASLTNSSGLKNLKEQNKPDQIISNLMQNIHILFGLSRCMYFSFDQEQQKLVCSAENINLHVDLAELNIKVDPPRSILAKAFNKRSITSSFESKAATAEGIVDRYITRLLKTDGMLCIPLFYKDKFYKEKFFGVLVVGVSHDRYPGLLEQRLLLGEFTRTAVKNLHQFKIQQDALKTADNQQSLHIRKLIHEANNPLSIISNYLQILSLKMQDSDKQVGSQIEVLQQEVERVANILLRMKEPVEKSDSDIDNIMENTNINLLIEELISVFQTSLFQRNQIVEDLRLDDSIPEIQCDRNGLKQVLINVIKNAAEAMSDGGVIEIETHDLIIKNEQQYIELIITDSGTGISDDVLANLFKPVSTTKGENHSGLGLSISKNIIDKLGGFINCHKVQGGGTKFVILLPRKIA